MRGKKDEPEGAGRNRQRLEHNFGAGVGMHEVQVEIGVCSTASTQAFPECDVVCGVVAFRQRREIGFPFVILEFRPHVFSLQAGGWRLEQCGFIGQGQVACPGGPSTELFEASIAASKSYPVSNQLHPAPITETANLCQMAARDPYSLECTALRIPLRIFPGNPALDNPWLPTNELSSETAERTDTVLNVKNGAYINGSHASISRAG